MTESIAALRPWLDAAWERHDTEARALATELLARAPVLPDDDEGAEAVRLGRHVMLGHLADTHALQDFLARVPTGSKLDPMRERAAWALAVFEGRPAEAQPPVLRWGLLADIAQAEIERGQLARARERLLSIEGEVAASDDGDARRAYAATCNNLALALRTGRRGDAGRDALMIEIAELSRRAWERAGTWTNVKRAEYQLAMCHAVIGHGAASVRHAVACLAACDANMADAAERFFAHECAVHAHRAAGDASTAAHHRERMTALMAEIADEDMRRWCAETLAAT